MFHLLLLAKNSLENVRTTPADKGLSLEWGIVLLGVIIGVAISVMPSKRTSEIKKAKEE